mgnify:CR=1 FL=1
MDVWLVFAILHLAGMALFTGWLFWRATRIDAPIRRIAASAELEPDLIALYAQHLVAPRLAREEALRELRRRDVRVSESADFAELLRILQRSRREHSRPALR